jgi:hypothetical protein
MGGSWGVNIVAASIGANYFFVVLEGVAGKSEYVGCDGEVLIQE